MDASRPDASRIPDRLLLGAIVLAAVALRAWHLAWGLPDFTEEAIPLQLAFAMRSPATGAIDWNPHAFNYPTLGVYVHLAVQQCVLWLGQLAGRWANAADFQLALYVHPTPMVLAARCVGVACDALSVWAAWRIARRFGRTAATLAAALVALSASAIATARSIYVDSIMCALALWAVERALAWADSGRRGALLAAAILVGLAAGAKYPAAVLLVPLLALALAREGRRAQPAVALAAALAALAFLATTPWVLLDTRHFLRDFAFEGRHASEGHFGSEGGRSFGYHALHLVRDLGVPATLALALAPLVAWRDRAPRRALLALGLGLIGFGVPIALARIDAERYVVPVVLLAAPFAAIAVTFLLAGLPVRARSAALVAALALCVAMPLASGFAVARRGAGDTQVAARLWCERNVRPDQLVLTEGYGPRLVEESQVAALRGRPAYRFASAAWRARIDTLACLHVVAVPLAATGRLETELATPGAAPTTVEVAPHASAMSEAWYAPAAFAGADWFVTTAAVRGRYAADPTRYPGACRFYALLDRAAPVAARFHAGGGVSGPEIVVYRLDARARAALAAGGALDPLWWTAGIPEAFRREAQRLLGADTSAAALAPRAADGAPAPWVRALLLVYEKHVATFAGEMAHGLAMVGRFDEASRFALANHLMLPADVPSALLAGVALGRCQRWAEARAVLEETLAARGAGPTDPALQLQYARSLAHTGAADRARELDRTLAASLPPGDPLAAAALADAAR